jgi:hypothetical protein
MLLSSILNILDQSQTSSRPIEYKRIRAPERTTEAEVVVSSSTLQNIQVEQSTGTLKQIENEIAVAAGLARPLNMMPAPPAPTSVPFFDELLRAIETLQSSDKPRVVDFFE